LPTHDSI
jgi:hypothetical protein